VSRSGSHSSYIYLSVRVQANGNSPGQHIISNSDLLKLKWVWKNLRPSWRRVPSAQRQFPPRLTSLSYPSASSWTTMYHTNVSPPHWSVHIQARPDRPIWLGYNGSKSGLGYIGISSHETYPRPLWGRCHLFRFFGSFLSFFLFWVSKTQPNHWPWPSGWRAPDSPLRTQEPVPDQRTGA